MLLVTPVLSYLLWEKAFNNLQQEIRAKNSILLPVVVDFTPGSETWGLI